MTPNSVKWAKIPSKTTVTSFILLLGSLTWYYITLIMLETAFRNEIAIGLVYFIAILISSLVASYFANRFDRVRWLYLWMLSGTLVSFLAFLLLNISNELSLIAFSLSGLSFGVGMPSCLTYFANSTSFENRGIRAGSVFLLTIFLMPVITIVFEGFSVAILFIALGIWCAAWLSILLLLKIPESEIQDKGNTSFRKIFQNKSFVLYLIPWLMFNLIDQFEAPILREFLKQNSALAEAQILGPLIGAIFALIGGYFSDVIGRKRVIIYGFVSLGIAYAFIGIATYELPAWYFYFIMEGVAWGVFYVNFVLVIWGDLAYSTDKEKYYVIGSIPFFSAGILGIILSPIVAPMGKPSIIPAIAAFSLASFFLFIAILPLIYAPETLPEKKIKDRQIKKYVEEAKKVAKKEHGKKEV